jgi:ubiquinone/menaquinone biosynthesis C-methylase UbiE
MRARLRDLLPARVRHRIRPLARRLGFTAAENSQVVGNPFLGGKLFPQPGSGPHSAVVRYASSRTPDPDALPVPPPELWIGYAETAEHYLNVGQRDIDAMVNTVEGAGTGREELKTVLDFGCGAGRMLRSFPRREDSELWGVDISSEHVTWCQEHLTPMNFATVTTAPHLPFADGYFDFVYCTSVFTHISDLADAWLLELRRIVRSGGHIYLTIQDHHSLELIMGPWRSAGGNLGPMVSALSDLEQSESTRFRQFTYLSFGIDPNSYVFYDVEHLTERWARLFKVKAVVPEAHDFQTAILLQV